MFSHYFKFSYIIDDISGRNSRARIHSKNFHQINRIGHGLNELWLYSYGACFKVSIGKPNYSELIRNATPSDNLLGIIILPSLGL